MNRDQLGYIAAYINEALRWRFSWYRQTSLERIRRLLVPNPAKSHITYDVKALLPRLKLKARTWRLSLKPYCLDTIYDLVPGEYHAASTLKRGKIPLVSCGDQNNGIIGFVAVQKENVNSHKLTIAFNGSPLTTKYHPYRFAAKDDVAVCHPRRNLRLSTELFIQMMMNQERWRYSYYRKCYLDKLKRFMVSLPTVNNELDEDTMQAVMESLPYWQHIRKMIKEEELSWIKKAR